MGNAKSNRGIPSSAINMDFEDDGAVYYGQRVGVSLSGRHTKDHRYFVNKGIYTSEVGHRFEAGVMLAHI